MGTIANKLAKLKATKAEIKAALEEAGESVGDVFDTYPAAIRAVVSSGTKIATGSYVGTGKYGSDNPNSLTFEFNPQIVFVASSPTPGFDNSRIAIFVHGADRGVRIENLRDNDSIAGAIYGIGTTWEEKTVEWYNNESNVAQMNKSGITYFYYAFG